LGLRLAEPKLPTLIEQKATPAAVETFS